MHYMEYICYRVYNKIIIYDFVCPKYYEYL